jgi:hypothetical protein
MAQGGAAQVCGILVDNPKPAPALLGFLSRQEACRASMAAALARSSGSSPKIERSSSPEKGTLVRSTRETVAVRSGVRANRTNQTGPG